MKRMKPEGVGASAKKIEAATAASKRQEINMNRASMQICFLLLDQGDR